MKSYPSIEHALSEQSDHLMQAVHAFRYGEIDADEVRYRMVSCADALSQRQIHADRRREKEARGGYLTVMFDTEGPELAEIFAAAPALMHLLRNTEAALGMVTDVMRNASGFITKGATATGAVAVGRAEAKVDNSGGAAGAANVEYRQGIFAFENAGADPVTQAGVGKLCFVLDDQTVAATDGAGTRSRAGIVDGLEGGRVWVRLDEAITRGA